MDLNNLLSFDQLLQKKSKIKKIFFYRICGTGMGACACLLKEAGFDIHGADVGFFPPMSTYLESTGIPCYKLDEVTDEKLQEFDLIVVGNSVPRKSKYAEQIENCGVAFTSFPAILGAYVLNQKEVIGIAGTHGKTTTSFYLTQLLEKLGEKPGYLIGGIIDGRPPSRIGEGKYFVIESDEYDSAYFSKISKFRLYEINQLVLTSLEFDHADIFETLDDIKAEFRELLKLGNIENIYFDDSYKASCELKSEFLDLEWKSYSLDAIDFVSEYDGGTQFRLNGTTFKTNVVGKQNILNLCSCILFLETVGYTEDKIQEGIAELDHVKRRQEVRGIYNGSVVIDDFAHHPRSVELTVDAVKTKNPGKDVVVIFEPVSATARSSIFQNEFTESLKVASEVILANPKVATTAFTKKDLDFEKMTSDLNKSGTPTVYVSNLDELVNEIDRVANTNSILLVLSNRTCLGLWESDFVKKLK